MTPTSRLEAQQRADEIRIFEAELKRLQQDGVVTLTEEQRHTIAQHHAALLAQYAQAFDIDRDVKAKQLSLGMRIASFLGALALAASVFFLFYQFWGLLSTAVQVTVLVAAALGSFLATMWVRSKDATGYFTKLAALVAFACFVLNIAMLGQIFNITPSDKALIPWAALALLLAYTCDLRLLLAAGILCFIAFVSARTGTWSGMYWLYFGQRPENFFPAAIALLLIPHVIDHRRFSGFAPLYRIFGLLTWFFPVLVLANWGELSYLDLDRGIIEGLYQVIGFAGSAAAVWVGIRRHWPDMVNTGVTLFVILLYTKFFDWWWDAMPKYLFFLVLGLTAVLFLVVLKRLRGFGRTADGAPES
jgi:uncharacterized membrane protein